jgi:hypothetical protein
MCSLLTWACYCMLFIIHVVILYSVADCYLKLMALDNTQSSPELVTLMSPCPSGLQWRSFMCLLAHIYRIATRARNTILPWELLTGVLGELHSDILSSSTLVFTAVTNWTRFLSKSVDVDPPLFDVMLPLNHITKTNLYLESITHQWRYLTEGVSHYADPSTYGNHWLLNHWLVSVAGDQGELPDPLADPATPSILLPGACRLGPQRLRHFFHRALLRVLVPPWALPFCRPTLRGLAWGMEPSPWTAWVSLAATFLRPFTQARSVGAYPRTPTVAVPAFSSSELLGPYSLQSPLRIYLEILLSFSLYFIHQESKAL